MKKMPISFILISSQFRYWCSVSYDQSPDKSPYELETAEVVITNVKEFLPLSAIQVYPNPVKTELFLTIPSEFEVTEIQLFGTNGQLVEQHTDSTRTLEVSALPAGLYYLRVLTTEGTWTDKVSVMK